MECLILHRLTSSLGHGSWQNADIGSPTHAGSSSYNPATAVWTVKGGGAGIGGASDQFHLAYFNYDGNGTLTARVDALSGGATAQSAGVMLRNSLAANDVFALAWQQADNQVGFTYRTSSGGTATSTSPTGGTSAIKWLMVQRSGSNFSAYYSTNDSTWTQIGSTISITMSSSLSAGLAVTAGNNTLLATATIDQVSVTGGGSVALAFDNDSAGNRLTHEALPSDTTLTYTYDNIYELLTSKQGSTSEEGYTYDPVGNRLTDLGSTAWTYNTSNEKWSRQAPRPLHGTSKIASPAWRCPAPAALLASSMTHSDAASTNRRRAPPAYTPTMVTIWLKRPARPARPRHATRWA